MRRFTRGSAILGLGLLACAAIAVVDFLTPLEVDAWLGYLAVVSAVAWFGSARLAYLLAAVATVLTFVVSFLTPPTIGPLPAVVNRTGGMVLLWAAAILIAKRRAMSDAMAGQAESLRRANEALEQQTKALSAQAIELRRANESLRETPAMLIEVQENERRSISRELHDESSQILTAIILRLSALRRSLAREKMDTRALDEVSAIAQQLSAALRRLAVNLRPELLDQAGLVAALQEYIQSYGRVYQVSVDLRSDSLGGDRLAPELESALYRIVQEALTNVARYARASHVTVILARGEDMIMATVEDDGVGFDVQAAERAGRLGLRGMRERAELRGGTLTIDSRSGLGTRVSVEIPCPPDATAPRSIAARGPLAGQ